jgi:hypothetical protein
VANAFVHVELQTTDLPKAKEFYQRLFDWKLEDAPMGNGGSYTMIDVGQGTGGGMMNNPAPGIPSHWLAYVDVDDVGAATEKARALGATIAQEKMEVPDFGWFSVIIDPTGAALALWQAKPRQ